MYATSAIAQFEMFSSQGGFSDIPSLWRAADLFRNLFPQYLCCDDGLHLIEQLAEAGLTKAAESITTLLKIAEAPAQPSADAARNGESEIVPNERFTTMSSLPFSEANVNVMAIDLRIVKPVVIFVSEEAPVIPDAKPNADNTTVAHEEPAIEQAPGLLWPFTEENGHLVLTDENSRKYDEAVRIIGIALQSADRDALGRDWEADEPELPLEVIHRTALELAREDIDLIKPSTLFWRLKSARDHVDVVLSNDPDHPEARDLDVTIDRRYLSEAERALVDRRYKSTLAILGLVRTANEGVRIQHDRIQKDAEAGIDAQEAKAIDLKRIKENDHAFAQVLRCMISDPRQPRQQQAANALELVEAILPQLQKGDPNYDQIIRYKDYLTRTVKNIGLDLSTIPYVPGTALRKNMEIPDPYHAYTSLHREHRYRWERKAEKREQAASQTSIEQYQEQLKEEGWQRAREMGRKVSEPKAPTESVVQMDEPELTEPETTHPVSSGMVLAHQLGMGRQMAYYATRCSDSDKAMKYLSLAWEKLSQVESKKPTAEGLVNKLVEAKNEVRHMHLKMADEFARRGDYNGAIILIASHPDRGASDVLQLKAQITLALKKVAVA